MSDAALNVADRFWLRQFDIVFPFLPPGSKTASIRWCPELQKNAGFSGTKMKARRCGRIWGCRRGKSFP
jgi:hypothetical protein